MPGKMTNAICLPGLLDVHEEEDTRIALVVAITRAIIALKMPKS